MGGSKHLLANIAARLKPDSDAVAKLGRLARRSLRTLRVHRAAALVIVAGTAISIAGIIVVQNLYLGAARHDFDRQAGHYLLALEKAVDRHADVMLSAGKLFSNPGQATDRWEFGEFADRHLDIHPGYRAIGWVPLVTAAGRPAYEQRAREDGLHGFRFNEWRVDSSFFPAGERAEYAPLYYVEPFDGNGRLLGFDLASRSSYKVALDRARETGRMTVADWAGRSAAGATGNSLLLIRPVHLEDGGGTGTASRQPGTAVAGFVIGLIEVDLLVERTLREFTAPGWLDTFVFEEADDGSFSLIYIQPSLLRSAEQPLKLVADSGGGFSATVQHQLADWKLSILVKPVPGTMRFDQGIVPWGVGLAGLLLTSLLALYLVSAQTRQKVIERRVEQRTAQLLAANESNAALEREISERKRVESELRMAKEQAEVASRAKSDFLAMVSHELRTPLNAVIGFSEMLVFEMFGSIGDDRYKGYAEDIRSSGLHLLGLINNILDLSKVEANKFQLNEQHIILSDLVADALHLVEGKAQDSGIGLRTEIAETMPALFADERALKQIILNLLSNAIKFTPRKGYVTVSASFDRDRGLFVNISDTGIGISDHDLQTILKPFIQVDSSLARKYEGTGLGLTLTKSLVELHGGVLEIESQLGRGTTVSAVFPPERAIDRSIAAE
ncbi:MAG: CHASE domain-containing protein [Alphaproteobacteria bacterium]|nr:CHASE domain-containing protein [Alphaproteobacteria bacterium]